MMDGTYTSSCSCDIAKPPVTFESLMEMVEQFYRDHPLDPRLELMSRLGLEVITPGGLVGYRLPIEMASYLPSNVIKVGKNTLENIAMLGEHPYGGDQ